MIANRPVRILFRDHEMKTLSIVIPLMLIASTCSAAELPRSSPEAQGVSSPALLEFVEAANKNIHSLHSFMLVRHGQVVAEGWWGPYNAASPHALYSLSKSFTSTAVGLAISEGKLSLDDQIVKLFPDDVPNSPSGNLKSMRIRDLLRMSTGHEKEPGRKPDEVWTKTFLAATGAVQAGNAFPLQHVGDLHAFGGRAKSDRADGPRLSASRDCSSRSGSRTRPGRRVRKASRPAVSA